MYALDNDSGVQTMPEVKAKKFNHTEPRWFTEGGNGVAPSYPGADWFNIVQAELLGVLKAGGINPDKANLNQLTLAIQQVVQNKVNTAISGKANTQHNHAMSDISGLSNALGAKAPLISPALTGTPTAPTASQSTNNTQIATTAFVKAAIAALVGSAPAALDTLQELANALGQDANFRNTVLNQIAGKADISYTKINDFEVIKFSNGLLVQIYESSNPISRSRNAGDHKHEFYWAQAFISKPKVVIQSVNKTISSRFNFSLDIKFNIQYIESSNTKCVFSSSEDSVGDPIHIYALGFGSWK